MTIYALSLIYGCKVSKIALLEWCLANPDSKWAKTITDSTDFVQSYINCLKAGESTDTDEFADCDGEFFGNMQEPSNVYAIFPTYAFGIFEITHDLGMHDYVIIGTRLSYTHVYLSKSIPIDTVPAYAADALEAASDMADAVEYLHQLEECTLVKDQTRQFFTLQNDCTCCS